MTPTSAVGADEPLVLVACAEAFAEGIAELCFDGLGLGEALPEESVGVAEALALALTVAAAFDALSAAFVGLVLGVVRFRRTRPFRLLNSFPYGGWMRWQEHQASGGGMGGTSTGGTAPPPMPGGPPA